MQQGSEAAKPTDGVSPKHRGGMTRYDNETWGSKKVGVGMGVRATNVV